MQPALLLVINNPTATSASHFMQKAVKHLFSTCALMLALFSQQALAETGAEDDAPTRYVLWIIISLLLALQSLLIMGLQRSRLNNNRTREALRESHKELEQRIQERTASLESSNHRLAEEIANHEKTVDQLRNTKAYLYSILNAMPSVIIGVDNTGKVTHWNREAELNTGVTARQAMGQSICQHYPESLITPALIQQTLASGRLWRKENVREGFGSEARYTDMTIYPLPVTEGTGAVIRLDDVTAKVKIEHMIIQNEKMLSLGELAAGIAHEINNPLGTILQNLQNVTRRLRPGFERNRQLADTLGLDLEVLQTYLEKRGIQQFLDDIKQAGERSAHIVKNMLEFSHASQRVAGLIDLNNVIDHSIELGISSSGSKKQALTVIKEIAPDLPKVFGSSAELQQVLLNLISNARHAMTEAAATMPEAPKLVVRAYANQHDVIIEVEDNGPGMADEIKKHIFEPFYTTKDVGKGTGLGLSVSWFIISEHHKGKISVESSPGKGALFSISLPIPRE